MGDLVFLELATMVDLGFSASCLPRGRGRGIYTPSQNLTVAAHLVRRLQPPGPETPHWSGNSGQTPEGLLEQPTNSKHLFSKSWCGDSGHEVRRLRPVWNLWVTPDTSLFVPTFGSSITQKVQGGESGPGDRRLWGCGDSSPTPDQLRTGFCWCRHLGYEKTSSGKGGDSGP